MNETNKNPKRRLSTFSLGKLHQFIIVDTPICFYLFPFSETFSIWKHDDFNRNNSSSGTKIENGKRSLQHCQGLLWIFHHSGHRLHLSVESDDTRKTLLDFRRHCDAPAGDLLVGGSLQQLAIEPCCDHSQYFSLSSSGPRFSGSHHLWSRNKRRSLGGRIFKSLLQIFEAERNQDWSYSYYSH